MKKRSGWIAFFIDYYGGIAIQGNGMLPDIYATKKLALGATEGNENSKTTPPQPVKIEWWVE